MCGEERSAPRQQDADSNRALVVGIVRPPSEAVQPGVTVVHMELSCGLVVKTVESITEVFEGRASPVVFKGLGLLRLGRVV